jgi:DNA ligase-1
LPKPSSVTRQPGPRTTRSPRSKVNAIQQEVGETGRALQPSGDEGEEEVWEDDSDDELQSTKQVSSKRLVYNIYHKLLSSDMCLPVHRLLC